MKSDTSKIYQQKSNQVFRYINENLHTPIRLNNVAKQVNVSKRQLIRIMYSHLEEPLYTYITRLRMERAIMYMQTEAMSLTKLAMMVGYDSPHSFSKAFKKQFKSSPKEYIKELQDRLREYTKVCSTEIHKIEFEEVFLHANLNLVYIRIIGKYGDDEVYEKGWDKLVLFLKNNELIDESTRFIGISFDDPNITETKHCRFYACASVPNDRIINDHEFATIAIPAGKYAVYTLRGSYSQLQDLYNTIILNLENKVRHGIAFEEYINNPQNTSENDLITKVYIPIK